MPQPNDFSPTPSMTPQQRHEARRQAFLKADREVRGERLAQDEEVRRRLASEADQETAMRPVIINVTLVVGRNHDR
jgi:hypothetical protein